MLHFLRSHIPLLIAVAIWCATAVFTGNVLLLVMPIVVFALWRMDRLPDLIFGFLVVLMLSDMNMEVLPMKAFKVAKNTYIVLLATFYFMAKDRFGTPAKLFGLFVPVFAYSVLPLLNSPNVAVGFQKTLSYILLFLVVPNYVLYCYRREGWGFFRDLVWLIVWILVAQRIFLLLAPWHYVFIQGRFRGIFGNPNGLALFSYLAFVLVSVIFHLKKDLFSFPWRIAILGFIVFSLLSSGSRSSLVSILIFLVFARSFRISPALGTLVLVFAVVINEVVTANLPAIVSALGLEKYFRLQTLLDGSGRYFAWEFAWNKIKEHGFFLFGGGFGADEHVMRMHYGYLSRMGHQGGVHNSYLTFWFDLGIVGLVIYATAFIAAFLRAARMVPMAMGVFFSTLFSITYESWLAGSLNPFTIMLLITLTCMLEPEIALGGAGGGQAAGNDDPVEEPLLERPMLRTPAR